MDFEYYVNKMLEHYKVNTQKELCEKIGISQQVLSDWKSHKNGVKNILNLTKKLNINMLEDSNGLNNDNFEKYLQRVMEYFNVNTITDFANVIGAERSTVNGWKSRKALGMLVEKVESTDVGALAYMFGDDSACDDRIVNSDDIIVTVEIMDLISKKASAFGMSAKEYINAILLEDLRKA